MKVIRIEPIVKDNTFIVDCDDGNSYVLNESQINLAEYHKIACGNPDGNLENILNERN